MVSRVEIWAIFRDWKPKIWNIPHSILSLLEVSDYFDKHKNFFDNCVGLEIWFVSAKKDIYFGTRGVMSVIYGKKAAYSPIGK